MTSQVITAQAVEAAKKVAYERYGSKPDAAYLRTILEAAAPHMLAESELMRWKLDALKKWAGAMIDESNYPQYGRDVRTLLEVASMDEAREIDTP